VVDRDAHPADDADTDLRIGLIAYRDIGDEYVTRDFSLTGDLDSVFRRAVELSRGRRR